MSIYQDDELTSMGLGLCINSLKSAFPDLNEGFHSVFADRINELGIGNKRLKDSINYVIDNCVYPKPTIAQFLSFDKKIKLYTYNQMLKMNNELQGKAFKLYNSVQIGESDKPLWASVQDISTYKLIRFKNK